MSSHPDWIQRAALEVERSGDGESRVERQELRLARWLHAQYRTWMPMGAYWAPWETLHPEAQVYFKALAVRALDATAGLPDMSMERPPAPAG